MPFLDQLKQVMEAHYNDEQLTVETLADRLNMSRSHLHRKLKQAIGQSANQFIREYRLKKGMLLLQEGDINVSEVAFQVGFGSASYFTTCFTNFYGHPPGEVKHKIGLDAQNLINEQQLERSYSKTKIIALASVSLILIVVAIFAFNRFYIADKQISTFEKSIAVLPFKNLNADEENTYFSEGVTEAINRHLSQMEDIKLVSLTSTARYRESDKSAFEIGEELNVSSLLEGSIQRYENTVRIEVRLIDAKSERQIWAKNYDRPLKDIFITQTQIAEQVTLNLKSQLTPLEKKILTKEYTSNAAAYDLYLKGLFEYRTFFSRKGIHQAIDYFKQAIALDSGYALAYTGLAGAYILKATTFGAELSTLESMALAEPLLETALGIDPDLIEAHMWIGFCYVFKYWDFEAAESEYKKAIITNNIDALYVYADLLNFTKRHEEALVINEKMAELEPYYPNNQILLSLYFTDQQEKAFSVSKERISMFNNYLTNDNYGFLMLNTGRYEEAISVFEKVMKVAKVRYPRMLGWSGAAYAHLGQTNKALALIEELREQSKQTNAGSHPFFIAVIYSALNDKNAALKWLQKSFDQHDMEIPWLVTEPQFRPLHEEPVFQALVKKVGLPQ